MCVVVIVDDDDLFLFVLSSVVDCYPGYAFYCVVVRCIIAADGYYSVRVVSVACVVISRFVVGFLVLFVLYCIWVVFLCVW